MPSDAPRIALITTTINCPRVLELYRAHDPDVGIFIAGDERTPHEEVQALCQRLQNYAGNANYYSPAHQKELGYQCSALIGWNTIARRNIATLEALKWGADIIITVDDDNIPINPSYFADFQHALTTPFNGLVATSNSGWFDVGTLLDPVAPHRGFPYNKASPPYFKHITDARIGVAAGVCLGDPDISAITRIARTPIVHRTSRLLDAGITVDPYTWTVFNSQNTAFIRELAPCFLLVPQFQRFDDIIASLIAQAVMHPRGMRVHFGQPMIFQQRNLHNLLKDLAEELWGETHLLSIADVLADSMSVPAKSISLQVGMLYRALQQARLLPDGVAELAEAWLLDIEKVL